MCAALADTALTEIVDTPPASGRVYADEVLVGLDDVTPDARARLDAAARWLQDAAVADVADAGLPDSGMWVVRRTRLCVHRFPQFAQRLRLRTFCSALGRLWAERRTTVTGPEGARIEGVALWVSLDPESLHPRRIGDDWAAVFGPSAGERRVHARLRHPAPPGDGATSTRPWCFRGADLDLAGHVNNAVYWETLEEELLARSKPPRSFDAEIEYRAPADVGDAVVHGAGSLRWIADPAGVTYASILLGEEPAAS